MGKVNTHVLSTWLIVVNLSSFIHKTQYWFSTNVWQGRMPGTGNIICSLLSKCCCSAMLGTAVAVPQQIPQSSLCFQCSPLCLSLSVSVLWGRGAPSPHSPGSWLPAHLPPISSSPLRFISPSSPPSRRQIVYSATVAVTRSRPPWRSDSENCSSCLFPAAYLLSSSPCASGFLHICLPTCLLAVPPPLQPAIISSPLHLHSPGTPQ